MKEDIKFQIEVLQRNKIIMACEAVAVNTSVLLGIFLVSRYVYSPAIREFLLIGGSLFGIGYALYASVGNYKKHKKIKMLLKRDSN